MLISEDNGSRFVQHYSTLDMEAHTPCQSKLLAIAVDPVATV